MQICILLTTLGAAALIWFLIEKLKKYSVKAAFIKSLVSALFVAVGILGWFLSVRERGLSGPGMFILLGLIFGLMGDIWLDLKYVFPQEDDALTYAGFAAFGAGHVLYITGLILRFYPEGKPLYLAVPIVLGVILSLGNAVLERPMKLSFGKMKPVVIAYGVLLFSMVLIAGSFALYRSWKEPMLNLMLIGGILFAVSDLILSGTYFGEGRDRPIDIILNYLTYYPAQFLIAWSMLYL